MGTMARSDDGGDDLTSTVLTNGKDREVSKVNFHLMDYSEACMTRDAVEFRLLRFLRHATALVITEGPPACV